MARNEVAFRALNEEIETKVHANLLGEQSKLVGFVCECGNTDCDVTVRMPVPRYEDVRRDSRLFFVAPGHEIPDVEDVVEVDDGFNVVRKHADVESIVVESDPRH